MGLRHLFPCKDHSRMLFLSFPVIFPYHCKKLQNKTPNPFNSFLFSWYIINVVWFKSQPIQNILLGCCVAQFTLCTELNALFHTLLQVSEWSLRTDTWLEPQKSLSMFLLLPEMPAASINTFILSALLTFPDSNLLNEKNCHLSSPLTSPERNYSSSTKLAKVWRGKKH